MLIAIFSYLPFVAPFTSPEFWHGLHDAGCILSQYFSSSPVSTDQQTFRSEVPWNGEYFKVISLSDGQLGVRNLASRSHPGVLNVVRSLVYHGSRDGRRRAPWTNVFGARSVLTAFPTPRSIQISKRCPG